MNNEDSPLIHCLCVVETEACFIELSIACFLEQTYQRKELLILMGPESKQLSTKTTSFIDNHSLSVLRIKEKEKWNFSSLLSSIEKLKKGDYICFWNASSWYHIARIEYQFEALRLHGYTGCILTRMLIYNQELQIGLISNKEHLAGSLLICAKALINIDKSLGSISELVERFMKSQKLYSLNDMPNLCLFIHRNSKLEIPLETILSRGFPLNKSDSLILKEILKSEGKVYKNSLKVDELTCNPLINSDEFPHRANRIPKNIHLVCKNKKLSKENQIFYRQLLSFHHDWKVTIYDDADALEIVETQFPELLPIYNGYSYDIQRVDIFRILIVFLKGGFYLDMDMFCLKSLNDLCHLKLVLAEERTYNDEEIGIYNIKNFKMQLANYMFGSIPYHPFWIEVLMEAVKRSDIVVKKENDILYTTGPWLLSETHVSKSKNYNDLTIIYNKFRLCPKYCNSISCHFGGYAVHFHMGTWRWERSKEFSYNEQSSKVLPTKEQISDTLEAISRRMMGNY